MSRLIVFGCSLAYGVGLPDCWPDTTKPSTLCWPQLIADDMNRELVNKSSPGSSNKRIWYTISRFNFEPTDVVIISWSYPNRYSIINTPWDIRNLRHNASAEDTDSKAYYEHIYSLYDTTIMSKLYVDNANRILTDQSIPVYNLVIEPYYKLFISKGHNLVPLFMGIYEESFPKALDDDHLGIDGHRAFAADLMNHMGVTHTLENITKPYSLLKQLKKLLWK